MSYLVSYLSLGTQPVGVQCPLTSSLGEFPGCWNWFWYPAGLQPVLVFIAFSPLPSTSRCFSINSSSLALGSRSCVFFTTNVSAHIRSTLHLLTFYVNFQAWDWLWYPMSWSQRRSRDEHPRGGNFEQKFCHL